MSLLPGAFRLALATTVILHHSTPLRLGTWAVGLFFCLSGFWIAEMWSQKYRELDRPYAEFIVSRWWRLAPVLLSMTALAAALAACGWLPNDGRLLDRWEWWASQPSIVGSTWPGRLLPPAWSLDVEMQFYVVAPLLVYAGSRTPRAVAATAIVFALGWFWLATAWGAAGESARLDVWTGAFGLGIAASSSRWHPGRRTVVAAIIVTAVIFATAAATPATRPWILHRGSDGPVSKGVLPATLTVATLLLGVPVAIATTRRASGARDRFLGDLSYPLYLFHWFPRVWYYKHLPAASGMRDAAMLLAANVAASFLGAVLVLLVIDRPVQRARARWIRAKSRAATGSRATATSSAFAGAT